MWELMSSYIGNDQRSIQRSIVNHVEYTLARTRFNFDDQGCGEYADDDHEPKDHELGDPLRTLPQFIPCS